VPISALNLIRPAGRLWTVVEAVFAITLVVGLVLILYVRLTIGAWPGDHDLKDQQ